MYASFISVLHVKVSCAKAKSHPTHIYMLRYLDISVSIFN
jgi:hypothetical protein